MVWPTIGIALSLAGVASALTLVFLAMRSVMNVGGFCAEGGPYVIGQHCPQGVPAVMVGSIWGGLILAFVYVWQVLRHHVPSLAALLWPALFLLLGWNFLEYAFASPIAGSGVVWGWLVCGIVFVLMGGLPLLVALPMTIRAFTRDDPRPGWKSGAPHVQLKRIVGRAQPSGGEAAVVDELERLAVLRRSGAIDDDEFAAAKRRLLDGDRW